VNFLELFASFVCTRNLNRIPNTVQVPETPNEYGSARFRFRLRNPAFCHNILRLFLPVFPGSFLPGPLPAFRYVRCSPVCILPPAFMVIILLRCMSTGLHTHPSAFICLCVCLHACTSACVPVRLAAFLSALLRALWYICQLSAHLSASASSRLSLCLSMWLYFWIRYLSARPPVRLHSFVYHCLPAFNGACLQSSARREPSKTCQLSA
jgi:hypothetical protein